VRVACFERDHRTSVGAVTDAGIVDLAPLLGSGEPQAMLERLIEDRDQLVDAIASLCGTVRAHPLDSVALRASVPAPGKVLCVMRNRPALAESSSPPWAYLKYAAGGIGDDGTLRLPSGERALRLAPELGIVVRGPARHLTPEGWREAVFGYTGFLDVTRAGSGLGPAGRDDWWRSWDTAFAVGPTIVTIDDGAPNRGPSLTVTDGSGNVHGEDPVAPAVGEIMAFLSSVMTLRSGDLIACGAHEAAIVDATPGSRARLQLPGSGTLRVEVAA
jgi:2-keto-4-pentenoate hydratase/2-oxohepta-3-ene-1,7-dioic acid hydratase in catechol pathway